ncbi:2Fe-2S iron-sulfur cluster-binding protein [Methylococcus sp. EFPC2]|uniref:2Fe-2S iron-sulfur cluster-binding protein n=1 Tax=Methylococcus sp. EFPC2 TaxID=2812648 RepID=UPI001968349A|nr:2Fe-2S iron-sulfur cluster-binding protein [Methylococcus sp. EFPC2]QSA99281.1 (2Fe-2S)-binding protein [Methylococcus sp. EFPC2]
MGNVTFSSPLLSKDVTVYATAGDTHTLLKVARHHKIPIPFECEDGDCGSCVIEVSELSNKPFMAQDLTDKERATLVAAGKLTKAQIEESTLTDKPPRYRLACQYIVRDEDVLVKFSGEPGVV